VITGLLPHIGIPSRTTLRNTGSSPDCAHCTNCSVVYCKTSHSPPKRVLTARRTPPRPFQSSSAGVPAVLVPYPHARNDEQTALAQAAALAVPGTVVWQDSDVAARATELTELLWDRATVLGDAMVRTVPTTDSAAAIAARLRKVLGRTVA
jgi:hypothetical protein